MTLRFKDNIILVFYGKFEVFNDILFFSSLVDFFSRFRSNCYYNFNDDKTKKLFTESLDLQMEKCAKMI